MTPANNLGSCSIHVALHEHETGSIEFSSWPQAVQNIHTREMDLWVHRNPDLDIIEQATTLDLSRKQPVTVTVFHYAPKVTA